MDAKFDINDDGEDRIYVAEHEEELRFKLRANPAIGVQRVLFQVWDASGFNETLGIAANPPRASNDAPELELDNEAGSTGQAVHAATATSEVKTTMPATGVHSWIVRCVVNGAQKLGPNGVPVFAPELIHERMVVIETAAGLRKIVATETTQAHADGWAEAFNRIVEAGGGENATPGSGLTSNWTSYDPQLFAEGDLPSVASQDVGAGPDIFLFGYKPVSGNYVVEIQTLGGLGVATFRWSDDNGSTWEAENVTIPADGIYELTGKNIWLTFGAGDHAASDSYSFSLADEPMTPVPGTGSIVSAKWRLAGNELEIEGLLAAGSGADWGSGQLSFQLPDGYQVDGDACFQFPAGGIGPIELELVISQAGATVYAVVPFIADGNRLYSMNDMSSFLSFAHVRLRVPVVAVE